MVSICQALHQDKMPFADEASAREHVRQTNERQRQTRAVHRAGYGQRTDKVLKTIHAYTCTGCSLWFVATDKEGIVDHTHELQKTIDRHKKSHAERRRILAASGFNTPRITRTA